MKFDPVAGFQNDGIRYLLDHHYAILGDDMGLGKTYQAIAVATMAKLRTLVICPAYLRDNWKYEIEKFSALPELFKVISYSQLSKHTHSFVQSDMVIGDEIHYIKNPLAKRTMLFHELLERSQAERFIGLSGTPIKNRVSEFYSILSACSYNKFGTSGKDVLNDFNYYKFQNKFMVPFKMRISGRTITKFEGIRNVELLKTYLKSKYIRRTSDKVLDLPETLEKEVIVSYKNDPELQEAYDSFNSGRKSTNITTKTKSAELKAKYTAEYVNDLIKADEGPVVVFSDHVKPCMAIASKIKGRVDWFTGSTDVDERAKSVKRMQEGKLDALVMTIGSGSTGFNLTNARNMVFNDYSWVPADNDQAKKRIHRIGQDKKCTYHFMVGSKADHYILNLIKNKKDIIKEIV